MTEPRTGWTQPLCPSCFAAWTLDRGEPPREPAAMLNHAGDPCLVCGATTTIYVRIKPDLAKNFRHAMVKS